MTERTLVVIFFFWAMLTIITPTLILWSESAKLDSDSNITDSATELSLELKTRTTTRYAKQHTRGAPVEAPAPAPVMEPGMRSRNGVGVKISRKVETSHDTQRKVKMGLLKIQRKLI